MEGLTRKALTWCRLLGPVPPPTPFHPEHCDFLKHKHECTLPLHEVLQWLLLPIKFTCKKKKKAGGALKSWGLFGIRWHGGGKVRAVWRHMASGGYFIWERFGPHSWRWQYNVTHNYFPFYGPQSNDAGGNDDLSHLVGCKLFTYFFGFQFFVFLLLTSGLESQWIFWR